MARRRTVARFTPVPARPKPRATVPGRHGIRRPVRRAPGMRAPAAPRAPGVGAPGTPEVPVGPPPAPDPQDALYWTQRARLDFQRGQQRNQLTQQQAYSEADFAEALRRRNEQRGETIQGVRQGANREGLFYSGTLGQRQGDVNTRFDRADFDARTAQERATAARKAAIEALDQGYDIDEAALAAEAVDRQVQRDVANEDLGAYDPPAAAGPPGVPGRPAARAPRGRGGRRQRTTRTPRRPARGPGSRWVQTGKTRQRPRRRVVQR